MVQAARVTHVRGDVDPAAAALPAVLPALFRGSGTCIWILTTSPVFLIVFVLRFSSFCTAPRENHITSTLSVHVIALSKHYSQYSTDCIDKVALPTLSLEDILPHATPRQA